MSLGQRQDSAKFGITRLIDRLDKRSTGHYTEPMTGIEPAYSAWEVFSTLERLSDSRW
jgi:hypothetical protein